MLPWNYYHIYMRLEYVWYVSTYSNDISINRVRTLTGKLIEFDVEPTDTVRHAPRYFIPQARNAKTMIPATDRGCQEARRGEGGYPARATATYLLGQADVIKTPYPECGREAGKTSMLIKSSCIPISRHDEVKLAEGGVVPDATLHLVLTLRGGAN